MRIALRELRRRPGRFLIAAGMLTLLVFLLLFLGGLLDGLYNGSTGALRAQQGDLFVLSKESRDSIIRSRVSVEQRAVVARVPGVARVRGLGVALVGAKVPGEQEAASAAVFGYEGGVAGVPPPPPAGEAWVDRRLEADGVRVGQTIELGRSEPGASVPVKVRGFVSDTSYLLQGGVWVRPDVWRDVLARNRPDQQLPPGTFQTLVVTTASGADSGAVQRRIERATDGQLRARTKEQTIAAIPGVQSQGSTFQGIIWVTLLVAAVVVALFFALLTLERVALYGVLKAIGASSRTLAEGLFTQAAVTATFSFLVGATLALALATILPKGIPLQLLPGRALITFLGVLVAALAGSAISLRRIIRIDPATAIGGGA